MPLRTLLVISVCCTLLLPVAFAQSAPPNADTFSNSGARNQNYGSQPAFAVQQGATSYIKFNLATLPLGVTINKATLRLYIDVVNSNGSFDVYQINSSWNEGTLTYNNAPPLGTSATGGHPISVNGSSLNQFVVIDITTLVQGWANGSIANNGLALALTTSGGAFAFDSKESLFTSHQPELEIALNGPTGPTGPAGPTGPPGAQGPAGPTGPTGATGPQGTQGPAGPIGATGQQGPVGAMGPQGQQGVAGPIGATGPQGSQGPAGPTGPAGTGFNFTGAWNSGHDYNPDDVATYSGSTYVATVVNQNQEPDQNPNSWSLMAQAGAAGSVGPAGATGAQGQQGPAGTTGAQGPQGPIGPMGAQGLQGPIGLTGPQGSQGLQGPPGNNGNSGQGFNYRSAFSNNTSYNPYDVVTYDGASYIATTASNGPNNPPPNQNPSAWNLITSGFNFTGGWNQSQNYYPADVVTYNGSTYEALASIPASGNTPDQNPNWTLLAQQGAQGPQGLQGQQGIQGIQGIQGQQGPPGTLSPGSPYYIQNGTATQTSTSFNIDGNGTVGGTLAGNAVNATTAYQIGGATVVANGSANDQNIFLGAAAGATNTPGQGINNTFAGFVAGGRNSTGKYNLFAGSRAGFENTTGSVNVFLGTQSGQNNTTGNNDIYLFNQGCPYPCTESNTIRIGTDVDQGLGNQIATYIAGINGRSTNSGVPVFIDSTGKLGTSGAGEINVASGYEIGGSTVLATGNFGNNAYTGSGAGQFDTGGAANVFTGFQAGYNNNANYNLFQGYQAGYNNTAGSSNIYLENAGCPSPCTENNTIRIGTQGAGSEQQNNTYIAGINGATTSSGAPVYVDSTGKLGTSGGVMNVASGYQIAGNTALATGNFGANAYVGVGAGLANTQGAGNAFVGLQAGYNNNSNFNTFMGYQAGYNNTIGSSNIYLGNPGCPSPCTESNTMRIGNQGTGSNQQNTTYVAGVYGSTASAGTPVYINSNGQLGTSAGGSITVYNQATDSVPGLAIQEEIVQCPADHPHLVSGTCGFMYETDIFASPNVRFSGPRDTGTWICIGNNPDTTSHTLYYGALCSE